MAQGASRGLRGLGCIVVASALSPSLTAAAPTVDASDRCSVGLLGVQGSLVSGVGLVDADAYRAELFPNRAKAIEAAKTDARRQATEQLRAKVCGGLVDKGDCDAELAQALAPAERVYDDRYACVVLGIEASALGANTASGRATRAITSLGQSVRASLRDVGATGAVSLDVVRTSEGCSAVGLEAARQQVAATLAGSGLSILAPDAPSTGAWAVALEATAAGPQVQLAARLVDPSDPNGARSRPVAQVATFPASAFGNPQLERACAAPVRPRAGAAGLVARLTMPTTVCAGDVLAPELEVSKPARVQVWSVSPDGSALLLVPGLDERGERVNGNWAGKRALPAGMATPSLTVGDEMLVAVAVPSSSPVTAAAPASFCRVSAFDGRWLPATAEVAVESWRVIVDPGRCPKAEAAHELLAHAQEVLDAAPECR